jgi:hypothetical protein
MAYYRLLQLLFLLFIILFHFISFSFFEADQHSGEWHNTTQQATVKVFKPKGNVRRPYVLRSMDAESFKNHMGTRGW